MNNKVINNDTEMSRKPVLMMDLTNGGYCNTYNIYVDGDLVCLMTVKAGKRGEKAQKFYALKEADRVTQQSNEEWTKENKGEKPKQKIYGSLKELLESLGFTVEREAIK